MIGWIIAAVFVLLIVFFPVAVLLRYDTNGTFAAVWIGPYKMQLMPKPKADKPKKEKPKKAKKERPKKDKKPKEPKEKQPGQGGSVLDFWPFVELAWSFLGHFRRKLLLKELTLQVAVAGDDAAKTAIHYGQAQAILNTVYPRFRQMFRIRKENVGIRCDFTQTQMTVTAALHIRLLVGDVLHLALVYGLRALKEFFVFRNKRKTVCKHADTDTILKDKAVQ